MRFTRLPPKQTTRRAPTSPQVAMVLGNCKRGIQLRCRKQYFHGDFHFLGSLFRRLRATLFSWDDPKTKQKQERKEKRVTRKTKTLFLLHGKGKFPFHTETQARLRIPDSFRASASRNQTCKKFIFSPFLGFQGFNSPVFRCSFGNWFASGSLLLLAL